MLKANCPHIYTVNQGQKLDTVGCYIMVTLPRAQGTHVKVGSKVIYPKYIQFNVQKLFCICFAHKNIFLEIKSRILYQNC